MTRPQWDDWRCYRCYKRRPKSERPAEYQQTPAGYTFAVCRECADPKAA